jgi:hypothetical protein
VVVPGASVEAHEHAMSNDQHTPTGDIQCETKEALPLLDLGRANWSYHINTFQPFQPRKDDVKYTNRTGRKKERKKDSQCLSQSHQRAYV